MLSAREFSVGALADVQPSTLVLPLSNHDATFLIGNSETGMTAVFLDGPHKFHGMQCEMNRDWKGLIVPNIYIEVDEKSVFDPALIGVPVGAIIRKSTRLDLRARMDRNFGSINIQLDTELVNAGDTGAGFSKWQVVIGESMSKRVLFKADVSQG
jgi:hypothetical protein